MSYKKAVFEQDYLEAVEPYKVCNTIDTLNRMNPNYLVKGIRFEHLMIKLKSQSKAWSE